MEAFVSSAVCIHSFCNFEKKLIKPLVCSRGSQPLTVTHHLFQKYASSFSIIAMSSSSLTSFHPL